MAWESAAESWRGSRRRKNTAWESAAEKSWRGSQRRKNTAWESAAEESWRGSRRRKNIMEGEEEHHGVGVGRGRKIRFERRIMARSGTVEGEEI